MKNPLIAFLTDFGENDFFVASVKGVISRINPFARIIDITHQVSSFDILRGSFILFACYRYFPSKTIFLVVVDPGVGSSRKIILAETENYFFIGPDNGVLSFALESEKVYEIREVTNCKFFLKEESRTFEARDKMAPVAAWLSKGILPDEFGPQTKDFKRIKNLTVQREKEGIVGSVIYVDKFGNLITNIPLAMVNQLQERRSPRNLNLLVKNREIKSFVKSYSSGKRGELFFLEGSLGLVEIASREDSASKILKAKIGDRVRIVNSEKLKVRSEK